MQVQVELYGGLRERVGTSELVLTLEEVESLSVSEALEALTRAYPALRGGLGGVAVAIGDKLVGRDVLLRDAAVISLLPPVSGG